MMRKINKLLAIAMMICVTSAAMAQNQSEKKSDKQQTAAATSDVSGSGTSGQIPKWTGTIGTGTFVLGNSIISEDKFGNVGVGTTTPTSKFTVRGMIETTLGGLRFPDGTVQTTSATGALFSIVHDATLTGNGTSVSPLGVTLPLNLTAPAGGVGVNVTGGTGCIPNPFGGCDAIVAQGGSFGHGVNATGGPNGGAGVSATGLSGPGIISQGADVAGGFGASEGVIGRGGMSGSGTGGAGIRGEGGNSPGAGGVGGAGGGFIGGSGGTTGGIGVSTTGGTGIGGTGGVGLIATSGSGLSRGLAARFQDGDVLVTGGSLTVNGAKMFHIDHPLDPENKYLNHAAIESSEVLNVYSGNITTDAEGNATINLPEWFEALNKDFRYQLTVVGTFAQAIVSEKIKGNSFRIKTNAPEVEVSWQVTGVRSDPAIRRMPLVVEVEKNETERGHYLNPEAYGQPEEKSVNWAQNPELMRQIKEAREQMKRKPQQQR